MEYYIKGNYRKSIYQTDAGYHVGLFRLKETNSEDMLDYVGRTITFTGYFHELNTEDTYLFYGNLVEHEKYGDQFQVTRYERLLPEEKDGIVEFLSSGLFKGIGEAKAKKIVDVLGKDTLSIILENPENLLLIPTMTQKQVNMLHDTLINYESSYSIIVALNELGFSTKDSMMIYKKYREKTLDIVGKNIYQLMEDFEEITYKKVDYIAAKQGYAKDDSRRVQASILYVMTELTNLLGHSYFLNGEIYGYLPKVLGLEISTEIYDQALNLLIKDMKVIVRDEKYYLKNIFEAEKNIANRLIYLRNQSDIENKKLDTSLAKLEQKMNLVYNDDQKLAIKNSFLKHVLVITGGPGTGKTTIIKAIVELYKDLNHFSYEELKTNIALLAPTGRASKRISEATLLPALTIHRFLKWNKDTNLFAVNEYNKSDVKFVIIDESSMVDVLLFDHLLKGLRVDTKIILVGDYNQLPSVGPGQILKDMIDSEELPVTSLNQLYRQGEDSNIITLAYDINHDYFDSTIFNVQEDLSFFPCGSNYIKAKLKEICSQYQDYDYKKFQVLAPMYKTMNGIDVFNLELQEIFNPKSPRKKELIINGITFRENDKVIQLSNMPDDNVFNGDIGIISHIESGSKKSITIDFDGNEVHYTPSNFNKFKHAYAISIHKSQGSEFDVVVMPMTNGYHKMLYRKLVYTGVTRAKKKLCLLGEVDAFTSAIHNNSEASRRTTLNEMLKSRIM